MQLSGVSADSFTTALLSDQPSLKYSNAAEFRQLVSAALNDHLIMMPCFENQLRKLHASVIEPAGKLCYLSTSYAKCSNLLLIFPCVCKVSKKTDEFI